MITAYYDEVKAKEAQISNLQYQLKKKDKKIAAIEKEKQEYFDRALTAEAQLQPIKTSLDKMTAEKGKWMEKEK